MKFFSTKKLEIFLPIFLSFLIAIAFSIDPLFTSNQNAYLLHGVAKAFGSPLAEDWMVNQTDPFILFSLLTKISYELSPILFYVYHILLAFILIFSLFKVSKYLSNSHNSNSSTVLFFLILFIASEFFEVLNGVAGQYILGSYFQPSSFGVFLLASIAFFCFEKYLFAIICCLISAYFHPTYIIQAAFLISTYQFILFKRGKIRHAFIIGIVALILISPLVYFLYETFENLPLEIIKKAKEILVYDRMHHHAIYSAWILSNYTLLGIILMTTSIIIFRNNQNIIFLLVIPLTLSLIFVIFAHLFNNLTMLLLFGQRASVWLMPLALSLVIMRVVYAIDWAYFFNLSENILFPAGIIIMICFSIFGINKTINDHHMKKGNQLISFLSSLDHTNGVLLIPKKYENIRLNAKVPIFVDWKTHPYKANEVLEWRERVSLVENFYSLNNTYNESMLALEKIKMKAKLNFIITHNDQPIKNCLPIYKDDIRSVYSVKTCF